MKKLILLIICFPWILSAQEQSIEAYINKHKTVSSAANFLFPYNEELAENDLVFFGYIHGCATPQAIEYKLIESLSKHRFRYLMLEVGTAQAYFLNEYLKTGNESLLMFAVHYQKFRTSQDASIQLVEKWRKIYLLNQQLTPESRFIVLGEEQTMAPNDPSLSITYLAHIAPANTGIPMIDSLQYFKNTDILEINILSGKPALASARSTGKAMYDFVYPTNSKYHFGRRFIKYYKENKEEVFAAFKGYRTQVRRTLEYVRERREDVLHNNFQEEVAPLIKKGGKVFATYGYTHVLQGPINGYDYLAGMVKKSSPSIKSTTILGILARSNAMNERKLRKEGTVIGPTGLAFDRISYKGYSTSRSYEGDALFERLEGINALKKAAKKQEILTLSLAKEETPFNNGLTFIKNKIGPKYWKPDTSLSTLDYIQYVIYMQYSEAAIPFEEM
ncbi:MAG: hypothetical protein AAFY41_08280 [Bacteroidota bacterium]